MINFDDLKKSVTAIEKEGNKKIIILQCTSNYPVEYKDVNLNVIKKFQKYFKYPIGFSDHTEDEISSLIAVYKGAAIIEKHFTLNKDLPGPDHKMSLDPKELYKFINKVKKIKYIMGNSKKRILKCEVENSLKLKKSLVANINIKKNEKIKKNMIAIKRPAHGLKPFEYYNIINKVAKKNIKKDNFIKKSDFY